jgi:type IV secretory pathway ATPase VirB11/archaellum biosynthesis ATPase
MGKFLACKCEIKHEGQELKLVADCRSCKEGKGDLGDKACFNGILEAWSSGLGADSIVLSGTVETQYSGEVVEVFQRLSSLKAELGRISRRPLPPSGGPAAKQKETRKRCPKCKLSPEKVFGALDERLGTDIPGFYRELRNLAVQISDASFHDPTCAGCLAATKDDMGFVLSKFQGFLEQVVKEGFSIVLRLGADEHASDKGPILRPGIDGDAGLAPRIRAMETKFDKDNPEALPRTLERGISRILARHKQIRPGFAYSWVTPEPPAGGEKVANYMVADASVTIYHVQDEVEGHYHIAPFEYGLPNEQAEVLDLAKEELLEQSPPQFAKMVHARTYVRQKGMEIIGRLGSDRGMTFGEGRSAEAAAVENLTEVLARYTTGFGISELLLLDPHIQDIYVDAPAHKNPVYITLNHPDGGVREKCITNIRLGGEDVESLLSRFRYESGRPFSEARPHLEHDLDLYNTRVTVIGKPLSPGGLAIALRRHSTEPWTLPRLIRVGSLTPLAAGLISFLIDGRSTILIAGGRGSGKTSLLGAIMLEFPRSQRILTIEDTMELPTREMQDLGYKLQPMMVQSSLGGMGELSADEALRVSLRLGESAIVLGEVRGQEAKTLYEAMRTGTAGSSVLGTIHGNSAKAIFDRVVHDLGIPEKSFAATDVVIVAGLRRPFGTQRQVRRIVEISEFDPETMEFRTLMTYDDKEDGVVPTDDFGKSRKIGEIASAWGLTMEEAVENIGTRGVMRERVLKHVKDGGGEGVLGPEFVARANNAFWSLVERHGKDYSKIRKDWDKWFSREARKYA